MIRRHAYRCAYCDLNWPLRKKYQRCPHCNSFLVAHRVVPMKDIEAIAMLVQIKHRKENSFYAIIEGGGFTDDERRQIALLETELLKSK